MIDRARYRDAITRHVCAVCCTPGADGICALTAEDLCAIERFLPGIVEVAAQVKDTGYEGAIDALRNTVCRRCREGGESFCPVRDDDRCMLERYFPLILDAIDEVHQHAA
jgi:hypothetical protein